MKPSLIHYFFGYSFNISTCGGAVGACVWIVAGCGISVWSLIASLPAIPLGWIGGALLVWPFLQSIGSRINGAPWSEGDLVHVLIGQHRGHVGRIYELWPSRNQVRVRISEQAEKDVTDVYFYNEVCRGRA
jgi:hypothetical protein